MIVAMDGGRISACAPLSDVSCAFGLLDGFLRSVARDSAAIALITPGRSWTYGEIDDTARRWATRLIESCRGNPRRVGVFAQRNETAYIGVIAAMYAGAAFVPLNRKFPSARTRYMIEQAELDALIVDDGASSQLTEVLRGFDKAPVLLTPNGDVPIFGAIDRHQLATAQPLRELIPVKAGDAAYLLFTSGSTGRPKGVPISHGNVSAFLETNQRRYALTSADRLSQTFDLTFDLSVFDLFMAWGAGAAVCALQPIELLSPFRAIDRYGISVWFSVPSVITHLIRKGYLKPGLMPTLRWSLFCGEALPRASAEAWQEAAPNSIIENLYGPTELTIACAAYRWDRALSPASCVQDLVPIGKVYDGLFDLIVGANLKPVNDGGIGELCVAGPQTFRGYWRAPELDAGRFVQHQDADGVTRSYYRTGDLVRRQEDGNIAFIGRVDQQVKIGGYRVELGEIEATLRTMGCAEAIVMPIGAEPHGDSLVAVVSGARDTALVQESLRQRLPPYMVPRVIHAIESMPLNANGKIDRNELRSMVTRGDLQLLSGLSQ